MAGESLTTANKYVAAKAVKYGRGYIGANRKNSREQIAKFLAVYGLDFSDEEGRPYAFCMAGAAWCFIKAWLDIKGISYNSDNILSVIARNIGRFNAEVFTATPSCGAAVREAKALGKWRPKGEHAPKAGWLVFFDWNGDGKADHVEIVESADANHIIDVGFNTTAENESNGGAVAERVRPYTNVLGFYATW